jgi:ChrR Cupin-like domain
MSQGMTKRDDDAIQDFLAHVAESEGAAGLEVLSTLAGSLAEVAPSPALRDRLLEQAVLGGRLWRFAEPVAKMLDLGVDKARELLDRLDDESVWEHEAPGIALCWVEGGPRVREAVRGFVRVDAGLTFPEHEHLGVETVIILQGGYRDTVTGEELRPGQSSSNVKGSTHAVEVPADGPDLLKLVVIQGGVRTAHKLYEPRP